MNRMQIARRLTDAGLIAIIRADSGEHLAGCVAALLAGGVSTVEITLTTPGALEAIRAARARHGDALLMGVGTVISPDQCRAAVHAGAQFVVTPVTKPAIIRMAAGLDVPIASGAFTPTEALAAHEAGADFVKLFPADNVGPGYVKNLLAPLPMLRIVPTGGVAAENIGDWLAAGCVAVGAASSLIPKPALQTGDYETIRRTAETFATATRAALQKLGRASTTL